MGKLVVVSGSGKDGCVGWTWTSRWCLAGSSSLLQLSFLCFLCFFISFCYYTDFASPRVFIYLFFAHVTPALNTCCKYNELDTF
jgi:hypothetical protein